MAGSVAIARVPRDINGVREAELVITFTCVTDSSAGTLPDTELQGLGGYILTELQPIPGETPITGVPSIIIDDANGAEVFDSDQIPVDYDQPISGSSGSPAGHYPRMNDVMTMKWVNPVNHAASMNMGNSKQLTVVMRLEQQGRR